MHLWPLPLLCSWDTCPGFSFMHLLGSCNILWRTFPLKGKSFSVLNWMKHYMYTYESRAVACFLGSSSFIALSWRGIINGSHVSVQGPSQPLSSVLFFQVLAFKRGSIDFQKRKNSSPVGLYSTSFWKQEAFDAFSFLSLYHRLPFPLATAWPTSGLHGSALRQPQWILDIDSAG